MASILPNGKVSFFDANGKPLVGGLVYFYIPNTSTKKNTWQDQGLTILNTNPIVLDSSGEAVIWGDGSYRQVVTDADGNLLWDKITSDSSAAAQELRDELAAPSGSFLEGFIQSGAGAVATTVGGKLLESKSLADFGAPTDGITSATTATQNFFNQCASSGYVGWVGPGTYLIDDTVTLPSNLQLFCHPNALFKGAKNNKPMFLNGVYGGTYTARGANSNIRIEGGTYDFAGNNTSGYNSGIAIGQATNIQFISCHFQNMDSAHFIELNSTKGAQIRGCTFSTMYDPDGTRSYSEALQIDQAVDTAVFPYFNPASMDGTVSVDIVISDCQFVDCLSAIGSHTFMTYGTHTIGEMNTDITITNCTIENSGAHTAGLNSDAIRAEGWHRFTISNVTINTGTNNGIRVNDSVNFDISNIAMSNLSGDGIFVYRNTYQTQSFSISNITLRTGLDIIRMDGVSTSGPTNYSFSNINGFSIRNGIQIAGCDNGVVCGLMAEACSEYGFKCDITKNISNRVTISDFTIRNTTLDNMLLFLSSSDVGVGICSLPAPGQNNITTYGCNSVNVHDIFFNGASLQDQVNVSGTATSATTTCVFSNIQFRGTAVNGFNVVSGATSNILLNNVVRSTFSGSAIVNNGTSTTQFGNNPLIGSATYDPPSLTTGSGSTTTITVTGTSVGDLVSSTFSNDLQGIILTAWVSTANTVSVRFQNGTAGTIDLASGTLKAIVTKM